MTDTIDGLLEAARARLDRVSPAAALDESRKGAILIDTRCAEARRESGVIAGAIHVPLSVLYWRLDPTSGHSNPDIAGRDRRIILFCADGYSSSLAAATLHDLGFEHATDIDGGFNGWAAAGLPVEQLQSTADDEPCV
jgi:rhodanese-related sulfurtransferase